MHNPVLAARLCARALQSYSQASPSKCLPKRRRSADRRIQRSPHRTDAARARSPLSPFAGGGEGARSPFGAPPRHSPRFYPRLGPGRASWNHRIQTGEPSPAPVQRAPRGPACAGRDDAQTARKRSVWLRPREPLPLRFREYPRPKASFTERDLANITETVTDVKITSPLQRRRKFGNGGVKVPYFSTLLEPVSACFIDMRMVVCINTHL